MKDPIAQLERSHRRLEEACEALLVAARERDIETVGNVAAFFTHQGARHEQDEEQSLFPRLGEVDEVVERLRREHREHEVLHTRLERAVTGQSDATDPWAEIAAIAELLAQAYRTHIATEESELFPAARRVLSDNDLTSMMVEMEARRGRGPGQPER